MNPSSASASSSAPTTWQMHKTGRHRMSSRVTHAYLSSRVPDAVPVVGVSLTHWAHLRRLLRVDLLHVALNVAEHVLLVPAWSGVEQGPRG